MRYRGAALTCGLLIAAPARAQSPRGITLADVVEAALRTGPAVQLAQELVRASRGRLVAASAPFDPLIGANVTGAQTKQWSPDVGAGATPLQTNSVGYGLSLTKQWRSGLVITPTVSVRRSDGGGLAVPSSAADVSVSVSVPILKNRFGSVTGAPLRAAEALYSADESALQQSAAAGVYDAVSGYWTYLAAQKKLEIRLATEDRAERLVHEMQVLVAAEERPASDLNQAVGNLATKRVTRMDAEQAVAVAQKQLASAIGADPARVLLLVTDSGFPAPPSAAFASDSTADATLVSTAVARRADLARQRAIRGSLAIGARAAEAAARPGLDLLVGVGYAGLQATTGLSGFVAPLYREIPGVNASVRLNYQLPWSNAAGTGGVLQQAAALRQADVELDRLQREAALGTRLAAQSARRSAGALRESGAAVERYRAVAESEKEKYRLGVSTLMEVILAEDALTNALLADVTTRANYATALVTLHYETGTLVDASGVELSVRIEKLLTPM